MGLLDFLKKDKKNTAATQAPKNSAAKEKETLKTDEKSVADKNKKSIAPTKTAKGDTKDAYRVLLKPHITEKATMTGTYLFKVNYHTNKQEIKKAIKALYGVDPVKVNIVNYGGKKVRWGRTSGITKGWKKAIITLKPGDKIEVFEGI